MITTTLSKIAERTQGEIKSSLHSGFVHTLGFVIINVIVPTKTNSDLRY
jgi:hypothetical protein